MPGIGGLLRHRFQCDIIVHPNCRSEGMNRFARIDPLWPSTIPEAEQKPEHRGVHDLTCSTQAPPLTSHPFEGLALVAP